MWEFKFLRVEEYFKSCEYEFWETESWKCESKKYN